LITIFQTVVDAQWPEWLSVMLGPTVANRYQPDCLLTTIRPGNYLADCASIMTQPDKPWPMVGRNDIDERSGRARSTARTTE